MKGPKINFPVAPDWTILIGDIATNLVFVAIGAYVLSVLLWLFSQNKISRQKLGGFCFTIGSLSLIATFGILICLFVTDQFHYNYIFTHSDRITELRYKIAAAWSGQEGSFLLWACCSAIFALFAIPKTEHYKKWFTISSAVFLGALASILAYESPFIVNYVHGKPLLPPTGTGLQPSLLNYWITIHPPTIFLGFGSLTVLFSWALSALLTRDLDSWVKLIRPWAILSATILGLGLCMGGFWAYETLGWGGFWAWDPVENSSLVPWCLTVAFIHGIFVQVTKNKWHYTNVLLAGFAFLSFIYGTFLTRSGILGDTSVHSFAQMDRYALQLLVGLLSTSLSVFLISYFVSVFKNKPIKEEENPERDNYPKGPTKFRGFTRQSAYSLAIWMLTGIGIAAGFGMSVPLIKSLSGQNIAVVEAQLYNQVVSWLYVPLILGIAIGPFLTWRAIGLRQILNKVFYILAISLGLLGLLTMVLKVQQNPVPLDPQAIVEFPFNLKVPRLPWMVFLIGLSLFAGMANLFKFFEMLRQSSKSAGSFVMHFGVIMTVAGLIISKGFEQSKQIYVQESHPANVFGYWVRYKKMSKGLLDRNNKVIFDVIKDTDQFQIHPGLYYIPRVNKEPEPVAWPYVERRPFYDLYFSIGAAINEASDELSFKIGDDKFHDKMLVKYKRLNRIGEAGMLGTKFEAVVEIKTLDKTFTLKPSIQIGKGGLKYNPVRVNENLLLYLQRIEAKNSSAMLQFYYIKPVYPLEVFYKPMTLLIWIGTALMTLGGIWSAIYRRKHTS